MSRPSVRRVAGRLAWRAVVGMLAVALGGCTTGADAVDPNNGAEYRFVQAQSGGEVIPAAERQPAPAFGGTLLDGTAFDPSTLDRKVTVINFWGSWCGPCRVELPEFQAVYSARKAEGAQFLGVNVKDSAQLAELFRTDKKITFPSLYDPKGSIALAFRDFPAEAIPSTVVLDRSGRVAAVYVGQMSVETLTQVLNTLLAES